jgi:hypothetical protein
MSAAYYALADARALTRQEAIGNAHRYGGYVVYFLHDHFANECKEKAINASFGFDGSSGMTLQQIQMQQQQSKDRKCISTKPMPVKVAYMKLMAMASRAIRRRNSKEKSVTLSSVDELNAFSQHEK